jgi:hypothetical protein
MWGFLGTIAIILSFIPVSQSFALEREKSVENCAGEVVSVHGTVLVRQDGDNGKKAPIALQPGNNLYPGDVVNTSSDGAVKILLKDKTIVDLGGSALFKVAQFKPKGGSDREVELDMMFGKMRVAVPKKLTGTGKFQIKTRAATMGVRGTEFVVDSVQGSSNEGKVTAPKTDVTVLQGKVDVAKSGAPSDSGTAHLTAGSQISTQVGLATSALVKLNPAQVANVATGSRVKDNTFSRAVTIESNLGSGGSSGRSPASGSALAGSVQSAMEKAAKDVPVVVVPPSMLVPTGPTGGPTNQNNRSYHVTVVVTQ